MLMIRPSYPYEYAERPAANECWPKDTLVDVLWKDLWWKGTVIDTDTTRANGPMVYVSFFKPPHGEGGPKLWVDMNDTRKSLVWDYDRRAIQNYRREHPDLSYGKNPLIGSWAEDTGLHIM